MDVATVDDARKAILKDIFWQMNEISSRTETSTETVIEESDDGNGNIVETTNHRYPNHTVYHGQP